MNEGFLVVTFLVRLVRFVYRAPDRFSLLGNDLVLYCCRATAPVSTEALILHLGKVEEGLDVTIASSKIEIVCCRPNISLV